MKKNLFALVLSAAMLVSLLAGCTQEGSSGSVSKQDFSPDLSEVMLEWDDTFFRSIAQGDGVMDPNYQDALRLCPAIIFELRYGTAESAEPMMEIVDRLMDQFYEYGYLPRPAAPEYGLEEGWVTGMDAPLLAVTCWLAYETYHDERYHQYVEDLIPYIVLPTTEHGFNLVLSDDAWWPLEYAWAEASDDTARFVLNGSLFAMTCIQALEIATGDPRLTDLTEKALTAYQRKADEFYYPNGQWCCYSLNDSGKKNPDWGEKLLIEMTSLDALYYMTGESFYRESCEKRREMLKEIYPVYATRNEDGSVDVSLLRAAAPHPYDISISPTILELLDKDGTVVETLYADTRYYMDNWIRETVTSDVTGYRMYSRYNEEPVAPYLLFEGTIDYLEESDTEAPALQGSWSARNDVGMLEEGTLEIDAERTDLLYGTAFFQIDGDPIPQTPESYWGVELTNTGDETISVSVILYDTEGNSITRYLPSLYPGKNLFLFRKLQ